MSPLDQALKLMYDGRLDEARSSLEMLLEKDPDNTDLLYNLGVACSMPQVAGRAIELLQKCIQIDPDYSNAYVALGLVYSMQGEPQRAKQYCIRAAEINPKNLLALKGLGLLFAKEKDFMKSLYYLKRAFDLCPYDPQTILWMAQNYKELKDIEMAEKYFIEVLEMNASLDLQTAAKEGLQDLAVGAFEPCGLRVNIVLHLLDAIRIFRDKTVLEVQSIISEIAMIGRLGLDISNADKKYNVTTLSGEFTALQLMCVSYAGFQRIRPGQSMGIDLSDEFELAFSLSVSEDVL